MLQGERENSFFALDVIRVSTYYIIVGRLAMKRKDLVKLLIKNGWVSVGGTKHEKFRKGQQTEYVPRHSEIDERLSQYIIKKWELK